MSGEPNRGHTVCAGLLPDHPSAQESARAQGAGVDGAADMFGWRNCADIGATVRGITDA